MTTDAPGGEPACCTSEALAGPCDDHRKRACRRCKRDDEAWEIYARCRHRTPVSPIDGEGIACLCPHCEACAPRWVVED